METPDCLFPSSNEYGIPDLMPSMQGDFFDYPLSYGSVARQGDYRGHTILFYVDDYRFNSLGNAVEHGSHFQKLWERPDYVWKSGAPSFVEANFSTSDAQAFAAHAKRPQKTAGIPSPSNAKNLNSKVSFLYMVSS